MVKIAVKMNFFIVFVAIFGNHSRYTACAMHAKSVLSLHNIVS